MPSWRAVARPPDSRPLALPDRGYRLPAARRARARRHCRRGRAHLTQRRRAPVRPCSSSRCRRDRRPIAAGRAQPVGVPAPVPLRRYHDRQPPRPSTRRSRSSTGRRSPPPGTHVESSRRRNRSPPGPRQKRRRARTGRTQAASRSRRCPVQLPPACRATDALSRRGTARCGCRAGTRRDADPPVVRCACEKGF